MKNKKTTKAATSVNEVLSGAEGGAQVAHEPKHHKKPKKQYL